MFDYVAIAVPLFPLIAAAWLGLSLAIGQHPSEAVIARLTKAATLVGLIGSVWLLGESFSDPEPRVIRVFYWLFVPEHNIDVAFWIDPLAATMMVLTMAISVVVVWFSVIYLHREPGFQRYFMLVNLFIGGMLVLVMGDGFVMLFIGWEWVGLCSALLIAFFHERAGPVRAGSRAFYTNRFGDFGLLTASLIAGHYLGGDSWGAMTTNSVTLTPVVATALGLALWMAAMSKSAQLPFSSWMVHAVEGPTTSTGLFYGAVMAHAGVYLMLRTSPILVHSPVTLWAMLLIGGLTLVYATAVGAAQADTKSALIYATIAQLGGMFAALGAGAWHLVIVLMVLHSGLRAVQFLLAPSIIVRTRAAQHAALESASQRRPPMFLHSGLIGIAVVVAMWSALGLSDLPWSDGSETPPGALGSHRDAFLITAGSASAFAIFWVGWRRPELTRPAGWIAALHDLAAHRFFLDHLQNILVVRPLLTLSSVLRQFDQKLRHSTVAFLAVGVGLLGILTVETVATATSEQVITRFDAHESALWLGLPWLTLLWFVPATTAILVYRTENAGWARTVARGGTALTFGVGIGILRRFDTTITTMQLVERSTTSLFGLSYHLGVDSIDLIFILVLSVAILLVVIAMGPRIGRATLVALLSYEAVGMLALSTANLMVMALALLVLVIPGAALVHFEGHLAHARIRVRGFVIPMAASGLLLVGITAALGTLVDTPGDYFEFDAIAHCGVPGQLQALLLPFLVLAVAIRMPLPPFHGWFVGVVESSSAAAAVPLTVVSFGQYVFMRLGTELIPDAVGHHMTTLSLFALFGMIYATLTGLSQGSLRSSLAYFQLALGGSLIVGVASFDPMGPTGGIINSLNMAIAGAGLLLVAEFIHARMGTTDFATVGGIVRNAPALTGLFLLLALAYSGFPGTVGFVAEHIASHGAFSAHPAIAIAMLAAVNLASVLLWWAFVRTCLGPPRTPAVAHFSRLVPRERTVLLVLSVTVVVAGLWLEPWVHVIEPTLAAHVFGP